MAESRTDATDTLPVKAVTLFSSGVSYTLREGEIEGGDASVSLTFRTTQVSDILKSLVLLDEAGTVRAATYPSRDPIGRTLQSFAVNVTGNVTRENLLQQVRGSEVRAETTNGETITGRVVGIEESEEVVSDERTVTVQTLNLLSQDGMVAVRLDRVRLLRLLDTRLDREFRDALAVLASGSDDNRRQVTLTFSGAARRTVRVGYVSESPIWKVSYRLVLEDEGKPYLQGWALVENTTEDDWNGVRLALISGRPVSFIQDLYQPLYVTRPVVPPDIVASPFPQLHGSDLSFAEAESVMPSAPAAYARAIDMDVNEQVLRSGVRSMAAPGGGGRGEMAKRQSFQQSVSAQASGQSAGELFEYNITEPVNLPRQQAAMIPIVAEEFDGEKISLYNADSDPRFPLNAFRLKNISALHLKAGPITVFDGGIYAGDARMEDIPPNDSRLITYAVDLAVEGERREGRGSVTKETLTIKRGVLQLIRYQRVETIYTLKSKAKTKRQVLIEHPYYSDWTLIAPENPTERTSDRYRFAIFLAPGESRALTVQTEKPLGQTVALLDGDLNTVVEWVSTKGISPELQTALAEVVTRRRAIQETQEAMRQRERERDEITVEQERIRKNLGAVDKDSSLYRRYMTQLEKQEDRFAVLAEEIDQLRLQESERTGDLKSYLDNLKV